MESNNYTIKDVFNIEEQLFNSSSWLFKSKIKNGRECPISIRKNINLLELNGDKNKYEIFMDEIFYKPMKDILDLTNIVFDFKPTIYIK